MTPRRTDTALISLRDDGIVHVRVFPGAHQRTTDAEHNLGAAIDARGGKRRPVLVDITGCEPLTHDVRRTYTGEALRSFTAIAMLVDATTFGRMIGNIYLQIAAPKVPAQLFAREVEATRWLLAHAA
jgi:hypothetical protein